MEIYHRQNYTIDAKNRKSKGKIRKIIDEDRSFCRQDSKGAENIFDDIMSDLLHASYMGSLLEELPDDVDAACIFVKVCFLLRTKGNSGLIVLCVTCGPRHSHLRV